MEHLISTSSHEQELRLPFLGLFIEGHFCLDFFFVTCGKTRTQGKLMHKEEMSASQTISLPFLLSLTHYSSPLRSKSHMEGSTGDNDSEDG